MKIPEENEGEITSWFLIKDEIFVIVICNGNVHIMPYDEWQNVKRAQEKTNRRNKSNGREN